MSIVEAAWTRALTPDGHAYIRRTLLLIPFMFFKITIH